MSIRKLSSDFLFYGLLDFLQRSISLIMVPLYTRVLSQADYGVLDIILVVSSIVFVLVDLQFLAGVSRLYFQFDERGKSASLIGTAIIVRIVVGTIITASILLLGIYGELDFAFIPSFNANLPTWLVVSATIPITLAFDVLLLQTRLLRRKAAYAAGALISALVSAVASVVFVTHWGLGIVGIALGLFSGKLLALVPLVFSLRQEIRFRIDRDALRDLASYSLPLIPGRAVNHFSAYVGRFFVFGTMGAEQNAVLAVCTKITGAVGLYSVSFRSAWEPLAMAYIGNERGEAFYVRSMRLFAAGGLFAIMLLSVFIDPLLTVLTPNSYKSVAEFFPIFAVATLIGECESNLQLGNQIARKTIWISISSMVYLAVNLGILFCLTNYLGIFAAGLGLAVSALAKGYVTYTSAQKHHPIPYDWRAFAILFFGCGLLLIFAAALHRRWMPSGAFSVLTLAASCLLPWKMLAADERKGLRDAAASRYAAWKFSRMKP